MPVRTARTTEAIDASIASCEQEIVALAASLINCWKEPRSTVIDRLARAEKQTKELRAKIRTLRAERAEVKAYGKGAT